MSAENVAEAVEHVDVLIVGAGLSGICAAHHLQACFPDKRIVILEGRDAIGGTWDLFRYPGIRSDSDMYTLGYGFRKWRGERAIADGPAILSYVRETARVCGIEDKIRFRHRATRASWDSATARWTVEVEADSGPLRIACGFLFMCSGYYDYRQGYQPEWPGMADYRGTLVHPQHWPAGLDYSGRKVLVIGSGATAITLVPAMAIDAAHVTMLQRSPSYILSRPGRDGLAQFLEKTLPSTLAGAIVRWKNILLGAGFFNLSRRAPGFVSRLLIGDARRRLGDKFDPRHYTPRYRPWDQRLCLVPDGDFFQAVRAGKASVVTDEIASFTPTGVRLQSGAALDADIVVAATGLKVQLFGGMRVFVDGIERHTADTLAYKGMMFSDIPNLACAFGYTNASWTLKSELTARYVCRLLAHMDRHGWRWCVPQRGPDDRAAESALNLTSGYVQRAAGVLPRQGARRPWKNYQSYFKDLLALKFARVDDDTMRFGR